MAVENKSHDAYFLEMGEQQRLTSSCCPTTSFAIEFWYRSCSRRNWFWRFHLVLRFWYLWLLTYISALLSKLVNIQHLNSYHVFTCVSDKLSWLATSPRSATDKYFWHRNFLSRKASCEWVNAVRLRRLRFNDPLLPNKDAKGWESCWVWCMFE